MTNLFLLRVDNENKFGFLILCEQKASTVHFRVKYYFVKICNLWEVILFIYLKIIIPQSPSPKESYLVSSCA